MNLNRIVVVLVVLITGVFLAATGSFAAKGGNGGGKEAGDLAKAQTTAQRYDRTVAL